MRERQEDNSIRSAGQATMLTVEISGLCANTNGRHDDQVTRQLQPGILRQTQGNLCYFKQKTEMHEESMCQT